MATFLVAIDSLADYWQRFLHVWKEVRPDVFPLARPDVYIEKTSRDSWGHEFHQSTYTYMKEMDEPNPMHHLCLSLCFAMAMHTTIDSVCKLCPSFSDQTRTRVLFRHRSRPGPSTVSNYSSDFGPWLTIRAWLFCAHCRIRHAKHTHTHTKQQDARASTRAPKPWLY
jgi:hypothetical protein